MKINRCWGIFSDADHPGEFNFYTMGVDRTWDWIFATGNELFNGFEKADSLWSSLQQKTIQFVKNNGGQAEFYSKKIIKARPQWNDVKKYLQGEFDFTELKRRLG